MTKSRGPRSKEHIDAEKVKEKEQAKEDLRTILQCGDEEGYVTLIKRLKPGITPEELVSLVRRFREERTNPRRGV